jgi:hypothetical protein
MARFYARGPSVTNLSRNDLARWERSMTRGSFRDGVGFATFSLTNPHRG